MITSEVLRTTRGDFEALLGGPSDGPAVLLLHGFPQLNETWRQHLPALANAGYRVIAPNQRGYGRSDRDGSYAIRDLVVDAVAMLDAAQAERAVVVGHDWGGAIVWGLAARYPERVAGLVALNSPPPPVLRDHIRRPGRQMVRSSYMLAFQTPRLPERALAGRVPRLLRAASHNRTVWTPEALRPYAQAFARPEDLHGPLNWYRGMRRQPVSTERRRSQPISAPVLVIWGDQDAVLGPELAAPAALRSLLAADNEPEIVHLPGAGHFVQDEAPVEVRRVLVDWLGRHVPPPAGPAPGGAVDPS